MNIQENEKVKVALDNLLNQTGIRTDLVRPKIRSNRYEIDGEIDFTINNQSVRFFIEIKQEIRDHLSVSLRSFAAYFLRQIIAI